MRYSASEKREIIALVERSHLPVRRTLDKLGIPSTTFYRWCDRYRSFGMDGLEDRCSGPGRVWNRIPDEIRRQIVELALDEPELSATTAPSASSRSSAVRISSEGTSKSLAASGPSSSSGRPQ